MTVELELHTTEAQVLKDLLVYLTQEYANRVDQAYPTRGVLRFEYHDNIYHIRHYKDVGCGTNYQVEHRNFLSLAALVAYLNGYIDGFNATVKGRP